MWRHRPVDERPEWKDTGVRRLDRLLPVLPGMAPGQLPGMNKFQFRRRLRLALFSNLIIVLQCISVGSKTGPCVLQAIIALVKPQRSHCQSDQLDRPDHPNSPTKRARPIQPDRVRLCGRVTIGYLSSRSSWSATDRQKNNSSRPHDLHDHVPINSTSTIDRYSITSKIIAQEARSMPTTPIPFAERATPVPGSLIGLDRVDLIGSGNLA